jgi:hypothetical protein
MDKETREILVPKVDGRFGAPMGRANRDGGFAIVENGRRCTLVQIPIDSGGYDQGGAYWGLSKDRLYGFIGPISDIVAYVWAKDREAAKAAIREIHPHALFHR